MKSVGTELNKLLNERGIKKKDFASKLHMTDVNLSKILKKDSVDASLLEKIAKELNIPVSYFFTENQLNSDNCRTLKLASDKTELSNDSGESSNRVQQLEEALKIKDQELQELRQRLKDKEQLIGGMLEIIKNLTEK